MTQGTHRWTLIGGESISDSEKWQLLAELFRLRAPAMATLAVVAAAVLGLSHARSFALVCWAVSAVVVLGARAVLAARFRRRPAHDPPSIWTRRFHIATAMTGLQWSLGAVALYRQPDLMTAVVIIAVECALITGAGARGHTAPAAAITQVSFPCLAIALVFALQQQWGMVVIFLVYLHFNAATIHELGRVALGRVRSEIEKNTLLEMLATSNQKLAEANQRLGRTAVTDSMTGLANRRGFDAFLDHAWRQARRENTTLSLLMIDVDFFKRFNDEHGHTAGDACLIAVATALRAVLLRPADLAARYGGEEFALVLIDTGLQGALTVAERARLAVAGTRVRLTDDEDACATVSIGVATMQPAVGFSSTALVDLADKALYQAKLGGRNCVRTEAIHTLTQLETRPVQ